MNIVPLDARWTDQGPLRGPLLHGHTVGPRAAVAKREQGLGRRSRTRHVVTRTRRGVRSTICIIHPPFHLGVFPAIEAPSAPPTTHRPSCITTPATLLAMPAIRHHHCTHFAHRHSPSSCAPSLARRAPDRGRRRPYAPTSGERERTLRPPVDGVRLGCAPVVVEALLGCTRPPPTQSRGALAPRRLGRLAAVRPPC